MAECPLTAERAGSIAIELILTLPFVVGVLVLLHGGSIAIEGAWATSAAARLGAWTSLHEPALMSTLARPIANMTAEIEDVQFSLAQTASPSRLALAPPSRIPDIGELLPREVAAFESGLRTCTAEGSSDSWWQRARRDTTIAIGLGTAAETGATDRIYRSTVDTWSILGAIEPGL